MIKESPDGVLGARWINAGEDHGQILELTGQVPCYGHLSRFLLVLKILQRLKYGFLRERHVGRIHQEKRRGGAKRYPVLGVLSSPQVTHLASHRTKGWKSARTRKCLPVRGQLVRAPLAGHTKGNKKPR